MNAPDIHRPLPLIVALAGAPLTGKKTIAKLLKHKHGFAAHSFYQPVYEAARTLYGISPVEVIFEGMKDMPIERLGKSPRYLAERLADHARETLGSDVLMRRLVERAVARGEWGNHDLVVADLARPEEVHWLRTVGGLVWWVRRKSAAQTPQSEAIERMMLSYYERDDTAIINDFSLEDLDECVRMAVASAREKAAAP